MSLTVHFVIEPVSLIFLAIAPDVSPSSADLIHLELSVVDRSISESKLSLAVFLSFVVLTLVNGVVGPSLNTEAVLFVVTPVALVPCAVGVGVGSLPIGLVVAPLSLIDVSIGMEELAEAISLIIDPVTLVAGAIRPLLAAEALSHLVSPFAFIDSPAWQSDRSLNHLSAGKRSPRGLVPVMVVGTVLILNVIIVVESTSPVSILRAVPRRCGIAVLLESAAHRVTIVITLTVLIASKADVAPVGQRTFIVS